MLLLFCWCSVYWLPKKSTTTTTATTLNRFKVTSCAQRSGIQTYSHEIETTTNEICMHLPNTKRLKMIMMMTMTNKCIKAQAQQTHRKALHRTRTSSAPRHRRQGKQPTNAPSINHSLFLLHTLRYVHVYPLRNVRVCVCMYVYVLIKNKKICDLQLQKATKTSNHKT